MYQPIQGPYQFINTGVLFYKSLASLRPQRAQRIGSGLPYQQDLVAY